MIDDKTLVWTNKGWRHHYDLFIGDVVMSFNVQAYRCEYDTVNSIESTYVDTNFMGIKHKSMNMFVSNDHPITSIDEINKTVTTSAARDIFTQDFSNKKRILYNGIFMPHQRTQDLEDVKWSARIAATFAQSKYFESYLDEVNDIIEHLNHIESRVWLDEFFHWNVKLRAYPNWMFCCCLRNKNVRDMIFHIGPRAGVGVFWGVISTFHHRKDGMWGIRTSSVSQAKASVRAGWHQDRYSGIAYNITTKNGNFLAQRNRGTFLISCGKGE